MIVKRIGNDVYLTWEINNNDGSPVDFSDIIDMKVYIRRAFLNKLHEQKFEVTGNVIKLHYIAEEQAGIGSYDLLAKWTKADQQVEGGIASFAVDYKNAFKLIGFGETVPDQQDETFSSTIYEAIKGDTGNGILSIEHTSTEGLVKTYTVMFTDSTSTTFQIADGHSPVISFTGTTILIDGVPQVDLKGDKGDSFTYADFTPEQIAELKQPATDAAQQADTAITAAITAAGTANTAADNADNARLAIQSDLTLKADEADLVQLAGDVSEITKSQAIQILKQQDSSLIFQGFAKPADATPAATLNHAYYVIESGTVFGVAASEGQVLVGDGTGFEKKSIKEKADQSEFQALLARVEYIESKLKFSQISNFNLVIEGHSFASTVRPLDAEIMRVIYPDTWYNSAVGGSHVSGIEERAATVDSKYNSATHNILVLWIGHNDLNPLYEHSKGAAVYAEVKSYVQDRLAAGWEIYTYTMTPSPASDADPAFETERQAFNNLMRTDLALLNKTYVLDTDAEAEFQDNSNTVIFANTHLTETGNYYAGLLCTNKIIDNHPKITRTSTPETIAGELTVNNIGAGVSSIELQATSRGIIKLTGNAKFYTDSAGLYGESDTLIMTGYKRKIYIKTSSLESIKFENFNVTYFDFTANANAVSLGGNVAQLGDLTYLRVYGNNTVSGDVSALTSLTYLEVTGTNTLTGSVTNLILLTKLSVAGSNTLSGDITNLSLLTTISCIGINTLTGSVTGKELIFLQVEGSNTISGDVSLMTGLLTLRATGSNTLTGDISNHVNLSFMLVSGSNTISGDIGVNDVVNGMNYVFLTGQNRIDTYTAGATWSNATVYINPAAGYGLDSTEVDNILIDMANSASGPASKVITLQGANAARTTASDAAVATLQGRGCTVNTNEA